MEDENMRIISLIPSSTEIVCALGFQDQLVGRSHECDYPQGVEQLPVCSEPKFDPSRGSSRDIDDQVKRIVQESLSVYRVDTQKLKDLKPDIIVTQAQCEVCAVSINDVERAVGDWLEAKPQIVSLTPNALGDLWVGIRQVAQALGAVSKGDALITQYKDRIKAIAQRAQECPGNPAVVCIEWIDPLMAAGNWMPEFIEMLGGRNDFGETGEHSSTMTWEELKEKDPDVIIAMPCGWGMDRCREEMTALTSKSDWNELAAARENRVYLTDGNQYFNRPGPRLVESLEILAEIMYPDITPYGHEGKGWQSLTAHSS